MKSDFLPNSFQCPNTYIDLYQPLLTPNEFACLIYAVRRIIGFNRDSDRISIAQFSKGKRNAEGENLDGGTGLSESAVRTAVNALVKYRLLLIIAPPDPEGNLPAEFSLQLDSKKTDYKGLIARMEVKKNQNQKKMRPVRAAKAPIPPSVSQTGDTPLCLTEYPPSVSQTGPGLSDITLKETQEIQLENQLTPGDDMFTTLMSDRPVVNQRAFAALQAAEAKQANGALDLAQWPEELRPLVTDFVTVFELPLPGSRATRADWQKDLRSFRANCNGTAPKQVMEEIKAIADSEKWLDKIGRPGAIQKTTMRALKRIQSRGVYHGANGASLQPPATLTEDLLRIWTTVPLDMQKYIVQNPSKINNFKQALINKGLY